MSVPVFNVIKTQDMNTGTGKKHWHLSLPRALCWQRVGLVLWCQNWALLTTVTAVRSSTLHSSQHKDALDCHTTVCEALRQSLTANGSTLWDGASLIDGCPFWLLPCEIIFYVSNDSSFLQFSTSKPSTCDVLHSQIRMLWSWISAGCCVKAVEQHC